MSGYHRQSWEGNWTPGCLLSRSSKMYLDLYTGVVDSNWSLIYLCIVVCIGPGVTFEFSPKFHTHTPHDHSRWAPNISLVLCLWDEILWCQLIWSGVCQAAWMAFPQPPALSVIMVQTHLGSYVSKLSASYSAWPDIICWFWKIRGHSESSLTFLKRYVNTFRSFAL